MKTFFLIYPFIDEVCFVQPSYCLLLQYNMPNNVQRVCVNQGTDTA
jgi:hypothetical protein